MKKIFLLIVSLLVLSGCNLSSPTAPTEKANETAIPAEETAVTDTETKEVNEAVVADVPETADCNENLDCFIRENTKVCTKAVFVSKESPEKRLEIEPTFTEKNNPSCLLTSYGFIEEGIKHVCGMPTGEYSFKSWDSFIKDINEPENGRCWFEDL